MVGQAISSSIMRWHLSSATLDLKIYIVFLQLHRLLPSKNSIHWKLYGLCVVLRANMFIQSYKYNQTHTWLVHSDNLQQTRQYSNCPRERKPTSSPKLVINGTFYHFIYIHISYSTYIYSYHAQYKIFKRNPGLGLELLYSFMNRVREIGNIYNICWT